LYKIVGKIKLAEGIDRFEIEAPLIAKKAKAGQFVVIRVNEYGERIPLTIADYDSSQGIISLVTMSIGKTTYMLSKLKRGDSIRDVVGPLGKQSEIERFGKVICVGGGVGIAPVMPIAKSLKNTRNYIISIIGAKNKASLILADEMKEISDEFYICSDDGSIGFHGFVSEKLNELLEDSEKSSDSDLRKDINRVIAIGPAPMMSAVCSVTKPYSIKTIVSLNSIMVDGTGMCGACRVEVGGETKFVCVNGPEFDGHKVNFNLLMLRQKMYLNEEKKALDLYEEKCGCKMLEQKNGKTC
jgi:ferredoxin--NADP+ reductase